jgi:hypothetical protein
VKSGAVAWCNSAALVFLTRNILQIWRGKVMARKSRGNQGFQPSDYMTLRGGPSRFSGNHVLEVSEEALRRACEIVIDGVKKRLAPMEETLDDGTKYWDHSSPLPEKKPLEPIRLIGIWQFLHGIAEAFQLPEPAEIARQIQDDMDVLANLKVATKVEGS